MNATKCAACGEVLARNTVLLLGFQSGDQVVLAVEFAHAGLCENRCVRLLRDMSDGEPLRVFDADRLGRDRGYLHHLLHNFKWTRNERRALLDSLASIAVESRSSGR
jgi:hypothetical protein